MFYRVTLNCNVTDPHHIEVIKQGLHTLFNQSVTINPGRINSEKSFITVQKCYHDETPPAPCQVLEYVETLP